MTKTETTTQSIQEYFYDDLRPKGLSDEALAKSEAIGNQSPTHLSAKKYDSLKSYFYDGDGLRISRKNNMPGGVITYYVWDSENPTGYPQVIEEIENNQVVRRYGYGLFLETIDIKNGTEFERFYVVRDGTNSVRMLLDSTGNVSATYDYDAFGNVLSVTNANPITANNPFGFHSEYRDPATELVYLRARWYQPENGRFVGMDKYEGSQDNPITFNKYASFNNNPTNMTDPSGNEGIIGPMGSRITELLQGVIVKKARLELWLDQLNIYKEKFHAFLVFKDKKGYVDTVLEGVPEKNSGGLSIDYGKLIKKQSLLVGKRHIAFVETDILNPYGETEDDYRKFKSDITTTYNSYNNNVKYWPEPSLNLFGVPVGNSNSFIGSILRNNHIYFDFEYFAPGWNTDVIK